MNLTFIPNPSLGSSDRMSTQGIALSVLPPTAGGPRPDMYSARQFPQAASRPPSSACISDLESGRRPAVQAASAMPAAPAEPSNWPAKRVIRWAVPLISGLTVGLGGAIGAGIALGQDNLDSNGNTVSAFEWKIFGILAVILIPVATVVPYALMTLCYKAEGRFRLRSLSEMQRNPL